MKTSAQKPTVNFSNVSGNIFAIIGAAISSLNQAGLKQQAKEMKDRVFDSHDYDTALSIITEYVEPIFDEDFEEESELEFDEDIDIDTEGYEERNGLASKNYISKKESKMNRDEFKQLDRQFESNKKTSSDKGTYYFNQIQKVINAYNSNDKNSKFLVQFFCNGTKTNRMGTQTNQMDISETMIHFLQDILKEEE